MAVAHDAATESHTGTAASVSETSFTFSHNPVGTPRGVLVFVMTAGTATDIISGVTYDGVTVPAVTGGRAVDTATEPGACEAFFLGSSVPTTDPANVVVSRTNDLNAVYAVCITVTAGGNTEATGVVLIQENAALAEQNVTDGSPGTNSVRYAGAFHGGSAGMVAGANSTLLGSIVYSNDPNAAQGGAVQETTAGQGSRPVGFNVASDDAAAVHLAIREIAAAPGPQFPMAARNRRLPHEALLDPDPWSLTGWLG